MDIEKRPGVAAPGRFVYLVNIITSFLIHYYYTAHPRLLQAYPGTFFLPKTARAVRAAHKFPEYFSTFHDYN